ncbi:lycopene beta-cyclase [Polynucleobacter meluiroseus]|uniref:Lycopene beta-cyclase n=1 Tax=Polynucleobacter meluiroseus TaxID=1938814 RepID=A0A240DY24_9BURK|nr:lycopene cyclase family protein [Polynucleobacter meluiroseus]SNX27913.1 lycopene beta-cyclase [Polynucleobacter meluiroseus]
MQADFDLVIIGGGCAGLSLGMYLAQLGHTAPQTLLLERRKYYENDRTWCFWGLDQALHTDLASNQWNQFKVQANEQSALIDCAFAPYQMIAAQNFYDHAQGKISKNSRLDLRMNAALLAEPQFIEGRWRIQTQFGEVSAKGVVDTRPLSMTQLKNTKLWQSFLGYELEIQEELFDPEVAVLMDFCEKNAEYIGFNYLLPFSKTRALIEFTVFAERPFYEDELLIELTKAVEKYIPHTDFKIHRTEFGLIPMGLESQVSAKHGAIDKGYVHVGLTAGSARSATGYAFQRIQRWVQECTEAIQANGLPIAPSFDPFLLSTMDSIFLNVLREHPEFGPELFMNLFSKVEPHRLIRFLSDQGHLTDYVAVISALPSTPFIKAIFK